LKVKFFKINLKNNLENIEEIESDFSSNSDIEVIIPQKGNYFIYIVYYNIETFDSKKRNLEQISNFDENLHQNKIKKLQEKIENLEKQLQHAKHVNNMLVKKNKRLKKQISK
jgi:predicted RNase H-like nuclease (RuvC/YqgF family)